MTILLRDIWQIASPENYKCHFARWNGRKQPLEVWASDKVEWQAWQEFRPKRDVFNRPYVFSLIQIYYEVDTWLFGGVFRVLKRHEDRYEVELTDDGSGFSGRLKIRSDYRKRTTRVDFEDHYPKLEVQEILREPYSGKPFPGYDNINLSFEELETLVRNDRPDWKGALESVKGVYLITDENTGKQYVGSASGFEGIWSRWSSYFTSDSDYNVEFRELLMGFEGHVYYRKYLRISLLEYRPMHTSDETITDREYFWRRVLLPR